jgi:hypothetical protein
LPQAAGPHADLSREGEASVYVLGPQWSTQSRARSAAAANSTRAIGPRVVERDGLPCASVLEPVFPYPAAMGAAVLVAATALVARIAVVLVRERDG